MDIRLFACQPCQSLVEQVEVLAVESQRRLPRRLIPSPRLYLRVFRGSDRRSNVARAYIRNLLSTCES